MESFRYSLDMSSKKYVCPNCRKKTFVYYVNTENGSYLPTNFGRCDREQNCNYHKAPPKGKKGYLVSFLGLKSITTKAHRLVDLNGVISIIPTSQILEKKKDSCFISEWYLKSSKVNYLDSESKYFNSNEINLINEVNTKKEPSTVKLSFHSSDLADKLINEHNDKPNRDNLTAFLLNNFTFDEVQNATQNYYLTCTDYCWSRATIFWQIDVKEQIRAAKIMLYNQITGKRIKEPYNHINWLHKAIKEPDFNLKQCLFGLHLINQDYQKDIAIVESEKTAIIMSIYMPEFTWLATGSKSNFKFDLLEPLKNRDCFAFPDKGEFKNWNDKAKELNSRGFKIAVSDLIEKTSFGNGFDLADYYLECIE